MVTHTRGSNFIMPYEKYLTERNDHLLYYKLLTNLEMTKAAGFYL